MRAAELKPAAAKMVVELAEEKNVVVSRPTPPPQQEEDEDDDDEAAVAAPRDSSIAGRARQVQKAAEELSEDTFVIWDDTETKVSLVRAWVEFKKTKADIKAHKKLSEIRLWENTKIAGMQDRLKKVKEKMAKQRAAEAGKIEKRIDMIHKAAEAKRLMVEAERHEKLFKAEKIAAKHRASLFAHERIVGCFGSY